MAVNLDITTNIYLYVNSLSLIFEKGNRYVCEFFRTKKELVSKLWSVSETNSKYFSNNTYYLLLLSQ